MATGATPNGNSNVVNRVKLGILLKTIREKEGKSQRDAALRIGYANATFVCNVEKGSNNIPINKLIDFAYEYCPREHHMMAAAILFCVLPDAWQACSIIFPAILGTKKTGEDLAKLVVDWIEQKYSEYGVTF